MGVLSPPLLSPVHCNASCSGLPLDDHISYTPAPASCFGMSWLYISGRVLKPRQSPSPGQIGAVALYSRYLVTCVDFSCVRPSACS